LGGLKDSGLRVEALSHELQILSSDVAQDALPNTGALGRNQPSVAQILDQAHMLTKQLKRDAVFSTMLVDLPAKN
jgi:inosine/xanthosine triphosphate pyrophosphatase family protein